MHAGKDAPVGVEATGLTEVKDDAVAGELVWCGDRHCRQADALMACSIAAGIIQSIFVIDAHRERIHAARALVG